MKRICFILYSITIFGFSVFAANVGPEEASRAAIRFITERTSPDRQLGVSHPIVSETFVIRDQEKTLYYIFNLKPEGWIAIAADDAVFPILAYSFEGTYDENNQAPQFTAWMKQYEDQIRYAIRENNAPLPETVEMWNKLTDPGCRMPDTGYRMPDPGSWMPDPGALVRDESSSSLVSLPSSFVLRSVDPLITTRWNQSPWYNELCPADPGGGQCPAGCVPVCMAQVMYYFRWPETGVGSYTYTEPNYGVLSADFGATTYVWNEMTNSIKSSNMAIAELLFHLGISCDLQYDPSGSGMYNHKAAFSLRTYFKYAPETQYLYRDSTTLNWDSVLIAHLDRKIPMYYAGWSLPNVYGHAFVCDGYQDSSFFHFNFGWGGSSDGYFYTSDLTPGGSNFNLAQEVVINCYPDTVNYSYPMQCAGDLVFTKKVGSFEDGSGPIDDYLPTASCSWLIEPQTETDSVTSITLNFHRLATNPADFVTVYDGPTTEDPVLGAFSGELLPPAISSTGSSMLVAFEAGAHPPDNGLLATYKANMPVWCNGTTSILADTAILSDGSFDFNYYNNSLCKWKVETVSGDPLTIYFNYFDTEADHDFLTIYDLGTEDTLVSLSGHYTSGNLPDSVTAPSGRMYFIFMTNSSVTANGWEIYYPRKQNLGLDDPNGIRSLQLFPNPTTGTTNYEFRMTNYSHVSLGIYDLTGTLVEEVINKTLSPGTCKGTFSFGPTSMRGTLSPGVYLCRLTVNGFSTTKKLIFVKASP